jgi:predicted DCC family thiol-disulfide oxidoreductase YuxK
VDGDCALCAAYAQFVSARDARQQVYFETQVAPSSTVKLR